MLAGTLPMSYQLSWLYLESGFRNKFPHVSCFSDLQRLNGLTHVLPRCLPTPTEEADGGGAGVLSPGGEAPWAAVWSG